MRHSNSISATSPILVLAGLLTLLVTPAFAQKGGKGDGDTGISPPHTYAIAWIENFSLSDTNRQGDLIGRTRLIDGSLAYEVIYEGTRYFVDDFFADQPESNRYLNDISDRTDDGSIYLCGSCNAAAGIRGWLMRLSPNEVGIVQTGFWLAEPTEGDDSSSLFAVNRNGESVGWGLFQGDVTTETNFYFSPATGSVEITDSTQNNQAISNTGLVVGIRKVGTSLENYLWTLTEGLQLLGFYAQVKDTNELGQFVGQLELVKSTKRGTTTIETNYVYDQGLLPLDEASGHTLTHLNDFGDRLYRLETGSKGSTRVSGSIYLSQTGEEFQIDDMIDLGNDASDVSRWFESSVGIRGFGEDDSVYGIQASDTYSSFILTPINP